MSLMRLKHEEKHKDKRLADPNDVYYKKPQEYAMAIYSYYMCFKCKSPYFGGAKNCDALREEANQNQQFKESELICANCSDVGTGMKECKKHGKDYIEFKCRFCCSVA